MAKTPEQAAAKWKANASAATSAYTDGINSVTSAPGQKAAAQKSVYVQNVQASADKWARNVNVPLSEWQSAATTKGATNYPVGISAGADKQAAFMNDFLPKVQAISKSLPPRGTIEQNIARMTQQVRETAKYSYKK
ncbi:MAG: hypothetical protein ACREHG_05000 [Candidatus Saccharimonadales bacterium]